MTEIGCKPSVITYSTLLNGLCKIGNTNAAVHYLRLMEKDEKCKPNVPSYGIVINGLCKNGQLVDALKLLSEMISKGIDPNVVTFTSLVHGACWLGDLSEGLKLLHGMESRRISLNIYTFNVVVDACCNKGKVDDARRVMECMVQRGIKPDAVQLTRELVEKGFAADASTAELFVDLLARGEIDSSLQLLTQKKVEP